MKKRKFGDGGETVDLDESGSNSADDSTREFAKPGRFSGSKPKVVTKEELAKSGLSLRDYMNKQQGLTRRGGAAPAASKASAPSKAATPMSREDLISQIPTGGDRTAPTASAGNSASGSELGRNVSNTLNAVAGLKGVQMGQLAAEAAMGTRAGKALSELKGGKKAAEVERMGPPLSAAERAEFARLFPKGERRRGPNEMKKGGAVKKYASGGGVKGYGQARGARPAKIC